jgi:hypothetical protein
MRLCDGLNYSIPLLKPMDLHDYGQARIFSMPTSSYSPQDDIYRLFYDWNDKAPFIDEWFLTVFDFLQEEKQEYTSLWCKKSELKHAIRFAFCASPETLVLPMQL